MAPFRLAPLLLLECSAFLSLSVPSEAAATRFVATNGNDANACTLAAPCRTLQRGASVTPARGELIVLNSGSYGNALTITRSITIAADSVVATLALPGGITVAGGDVVAFRHLQLNGGGTGQTGILIQSATAVHIENCIVERFASNGIQFDDDSELSISDSVVRDNGLDGLRAFASGNATRVTVSNSRFENNNDDGMQIDGTRATITRSVVSSNGGNGVEQVGGRLNVSWTTAANNAGNGFLISNGGEMNLEFSEARENLNGLVVQAGTTARISNNAFTSNEFGLVNDGATLTRQNNNLGGNAIDDIDTGDGSTFDAIPTT